MARFDVSGLDGVIAEMSRRQQLAGPLADKMLTVGAEKVKEAWKRSAEEHGHRATGAMIESIGYKSPKQGSTDVRTVDIYPQGKDARGVRNAEKAFLLHYGTSKMRGSRWVDDAERYSEETAIPAMREVWEKENK